MKFETNWSTIAYFILVAVVPAIAIRYGASPAWLASTLFFCLVSFEVISRIGSHPLRQLAMAVTTLFVVLCNSVLGASYYLQGEGVNDNLLFHMQWDIIYGFPAYRVPLAGLVLLLLLTIFLATWMVRVQKRPFAGSWAWVLLPISFLLFTPVFQGAQYGVERSKGAAYTLSDVDIHLPTEEITEPAPGTGSATPHVDAREGPVESVPADLSASSPEAWSAHVTSIPENPMNLVLVYMEGLEQSYFDIPGLMPKLSEWRKQTIWFSNVYQEAPGSTMVGIVATQCGWPIFRVHHPGDPEGESFLRKLRCLGDELADAGYSTVYMGGADNRFTGKRLFLESHGFGLVLGGPELKGRLKDPDYVNYWGLQDDSLFEMAGDEIERLSREKAPFALVLLTIGTHVPGYLARTCPAYDASQNEMVKAVHCTDTLVFNFIQSVRASPVSDETVIVVMSDHLMLNPTSQGVQLGKRRLSFMIDIPGEKARIMDQKGTHFDVAATVLDALGFRFGGRIGLGSSLLRGEGFLWSPDRNFRNEVEMRSFVTSQEMRDFIDAQW